MLKTLIIATVLLPRLTIAQQSQQLPLPRQPGQWCPVGWMVSDSHGVPGSDKAPAAIPKEWLLSGRLARERQLLHSLTGSAEGGAPATPAFSSECQADDATRCGSDGQISGGSRTGGKATKKRCVDLIEAAWHRQQRIGHKSPRPAGCRGGTG